MDKDRGIQGRREAISQLLAAARGTVLESVGPELAVGRVLGSEVVGGCPVPEVPCSQRDGYALCAADIAAATHDHPVEISPVGVIRAEAVEVLPLAGGHAARVLTGGPIPEGADTVVADERVTCGAGGVAFRAPTTPGKHVLPSGGDLPAEARIGQAGDIVTPQLAAVMVRSRVSSVKVHVIPTAAVFSIGSELIDPYGQNGQGGSGRMPADNVVLASGLLRSGGFHVVGRVVVPDDVQALQEQLETFQADLIITMGGTGRSERDVARQGVEAAGFGSVFHGVDIRPGKGMFAAAKDGRVLLGLPGPPGAVFACLHAFLPALAAHLRGFPSYTPTFAVVEEGIRPRKKGDWLVPCTVHRGGPVVTARPLADDRLAPLVALSRAHGVLAVPFGADIPPGGNVELLVLG